MKNYFAILLLFISIATIQAQDRRGIIRVEKSNKNFILKPCICGQTDTLFINRKDLLDKKFIHIELCEGKNKILKSNVISYSSLVGNYSDICLYCENGNLISGLFYEVNRFFPKSATIIIKDIKYNTDSGVATLPGNLVVALTD